MDKAKAAVKGFVSKGGIHDTTVSERVAPAITNETITKQKHEETTAAIDREVHQDHYHTTVQPVQDRDVLPEQHSNRVAPVEEREFGTPGGADRGLKERIEQEAAGFQNTRTKGATEESYSTGATVAGEHVHHHIYENIQPVVQKETIQPSVVHTTVPIHEVHHEGAKHHAASALPPMSMSDYQSQGGTLGGREERFDKFSGDPKPLGSGTTGSNTTSGPHESNLLNKGDPRVDSDRDGSRNAGLTQQSGGSRVPGSTGNEYGSTGTGVGSTGPGYGSTGTGGGSTGPGYGSTGTGVGSTTTGERKKPSLMDKLNPKKDTDGDGKTGFMD